MQSAVFDLIVDAVKDLNEGMEIKVPVEIGRDAPLFGAQGALDSVQLVSLVVSIEQAIEDRLGISVVLADEKALSRAQSPFQTIGTLTEYAAGLLPQKN